MSKHEKVDAHFFDNAKFKGVLSQTQIDYLADEVKQRRENGESDLCAHEIAVEKGILSVEAALAVINASPSDTINTLVARAESGETERHPRIDPEGEEVPHLVEPLPDENVLADDTGSGDSHLEMEPLPPTQKSGDSIFDEQSGPTIPTDSGMSELKPTAADTLHDPSPELAPSSSDTLHDPEPAESGASETLYDSSAQVLMPESQPKDVQHLHDADSTSTGETDLPTQPTSTPVLQPTAATKGATQDFGAFDDPNVEVADPDESDTYSSSRHDSAVSEVMEQADDGYFGPPADLTQTPKVLAEESVAPVSMMQGDTLFNSDDIQSPDELERKTSRMESRPPSVIEEDDEELDVSITLSGAMPGEKPDSQVSTDAKTIAADSDYPLSDSTGGERPTTKGATGEVVKPGLGRTTGRMGHESETGSSPGMTLSEIKLKMGLGDGVKIGSGAMARLKGESSKRRYSVQREIARGGMGKVIEVEDNDLRRSVALKVLRKEMLDRRDLVERFLEEAQITGQLEHPNIVPVHEIGVDGRGNLYFTMKLVEGEEFAAIIKRLRKHDSNTERSWPISRLVDVFIKICEGIAFAHSKGVIHRDLKPANIMVGRFGEVQIMDWGVAKIVGRKEDTSDRTVVSDRQEDDVLKTMVGSVLGTPSYMSPEQARGEIDGMGPASDIFALGVILYELLALKTPWTAQTSAQVMDQVREMDPDLPSVRTPDRRIPPELEALAMRCLEKEPDHRLSSVQDLIDNLRSWQEGRALAAVDYSTWQLFSKWVARNKVAVFGASAVAAALIIGIVLTFQFVRQGQISEAETWIANGDTQNASAQSALDAGRYDEAITVAEKARGEFTKAMGVIPDSEDAASGVETSFAIAGGAQAAKKELEDKAKREQAERERKQKIQDSLRDANAQMEAAQKLENDPGVPFEKQKEAFDEAARLYLVVQSIDEDNPDAALAIGKIDEWNKSIDQRRLEAKALNEMNTLVEQAESDLKAAKALASDEYVKASKDLPVVISTAEQAISSNAQGDEATKLRNRAYDIKASAALEFARRALERNSFEICAFMLNSADATNRMKPEITSMRKTLNAEVAAQSNFNKMVADAEEALNLKSWASAKNHLRNAIEAAKTSPYATDEVRARLARGLELAKVEDLKASESEAKTSEDINRILTDYDTLIEELNDTDYIRTAKNNRDLLRSRMAETLLSEAEFRTEDLTLKGELYERALKFVTDETRRDSIQQKLNEVKVQIAQDRVSEEFVLLPRGSFVVGSNRDGDRNPMRTVENNEFLFIDRYPVTNAEYKKFIDDGGYERPDLWPEDARELLPTLVDSTGNVGPKGWIDGGFDESLGKYPVTGICWYEAAAYAKWAGKRLPTCEEWEIAAGATAAGNAAQGDYPFGERDDAPVDGVLETREVGTAEWDKNPLGVRDMGSNVSEWTSSMHKQRSVVKGSEPGLRAELFFRYARRAKNSFASLSDRSMGRGFRCVKPLELNTEKDNDGAQDN